MSIIKRRMESMQANLNEEIRLCITCGERVEYIYDPPVTSILFEYSPTGPFTTIWHCGCSKIIPMKCVCCGQPAASSKIPVCTDCLQKYEEEIVEVAASMCCKRCGMPIPRSEIEIYFETDMCAWCGHMTSKIERDDKNDWSPEKELKLENQKIITPDDFLSEKVTLVTDPRLIRYIAEHPSEVFTLSPHDFEEFIAELLQKMGYKTRVSPRGSDGGIDVFAEQDKDVGTELILVQCKRYKASSKISEPVVKQLLANVYDKKASRGLFVTTSTFSKPALKFIQAWKYRLSGVDYNQLKEWIMKLKGHH